MSFLLHSDSTHRSFGRLSQSVVVGVLLACPAAVAAQDAPRAVEFIASADHAAALPDGRAVVATYYLEFQLTAAHAPFQVNDIGKPAPDAMGNVSVDLAAMPVAWPLVGGTYEVRVTAIGPTGEGRSAPSAPFVVGPAPNVPPVVALTSPAHGTSYHAPASVSVAATASDQDGSVARVDFYRDATLVASDATAPYAATAAGLAAGSYTFTATAIDDRGGARTSTPAVVAVTVPPAAPREVGPSADSYVRGGRYAWRNYGGSTTLYVRRASRADHVRESYLTFDTGAGAEPQRATLRLALRLDGSSSSPVSVAAFGVPNAGWAETSITYGTRPASATSALATVSVSSTTSAYFELDVTSHVRAERAAGRTRVSFALKGPAESGAAVLLPSREAGNGAVLRLQ